MLKLVNIVKDYQVADTTIKALKGVSMEFRKSEFVSILGQSGCGKTTLLNIIGGLDRYTSGDLIINGKSTKDFNDRDWDTYRNHSVGFIFQSYNLIPHLTVLGNVELALTLSGVSKEERRKKAIEALTKVGLADQIDKKPNQMSGGQMQRVAIARALVNDPEIILADEPTGALDTKTSVQIMDILKEISKDKLIIMVTHNPDLANEYSNRIIRLLDGEVIDDTNSYKSDENQVYEEKIAKKTSMSFLTALSLSFKNLLTKKGRTILTSFAGSIGIIGIALILSLSSGFQNYIDKVQEDTLSTYPISINATSVDYSAILMAMSGKNKVETDNTKEEVYTSSVMIDMFNAISNSARANNLKPFKSYLDKNEEVKEYTSSIQYTYNIDLNIYGNDGSQLNPSTIFTDLMLEVMLAKNKQLPPEQQQTDAQIKAMFNAMPVANGNLDMGIWSEMLSNQELLNSQYDVIKGSWPSNDENRYKEIVLVVDEFNQVNDYALYALGLKSEPTLEDIANNMVRDENYTLPSSSISFDSIIGKTYKLVLTPDYYYQNGKGYSDMRDIEGFDDISVPNSMRDNLVNNAEEIKIVGIVRPKNGVSATSISGTIGYTEELTKHIIEKVNNHPLVVKQRENSDINVLTGLPFNVSENVYTIDDVKTYMASKMVDPTEGALFAEYIVGGMVSQFMESGMTKEQAEAIIIANSKENLDTFFGTATLEDNLDKLNVIDLSNPSGISIFSKDFKAKKEVERIIKEYNVQVTDEADEITYSDYIGLMMSSVSVIIDAISYVLIGFVSISLVVSSIMIGIITYISVLERTKEIGVLRSIGASKKDISRVFNAETLIVGFTAGMIGIIVTILLNIPISLIINALTGIPNVASLPWLGGVILVLISMFLTLIAGLIPSRLAAKKDPVIALRTE